MNLTRTICGLAALAATAAPASAQFALMPTPRGPNRILYPAPPWITNGLRAGVPAAHAAAVSATPLGRLPEVNEVRPAWTGPKGPDASAPVLPLEAPPVVQLTGPVAPAALPAIPPAPAVRVATVPVATPTAAPMPVTPAAATAPRPHAMPERSVVPPRSTARPVSAATGVRPDVWKPTATIPATLPGTTVPAASRKQ